MAAPKRKRYSPVEIDTALAVLAFYGGNSPRTSAETGVEESLLRRWRLYTHRDRYQEIINNRSAELEALSVTHSREIMIRAGEAEHSVLDRFNDETLTTKELAELSGALQRLATANGIHVDKMLTMTGRPTQYTEHRDGNDILRSLGAKIPGLVLEAAAAELREMPLLTTSHDANARGSRSPSIHAVEPRTDRSG